MSEITVQGRSEYSHITVSNEARLHAGDSYNTGDTYNVGNVNIIYQREKVSGTEVLQAFGSYTSFLLAIRLATDVVDTGRRLFEPATPKLTKELERLRQDRNWVSDVSANLELALDSHDAQSLAARRLECQTQAGKLLEDIAELDTRQRNFTVYRGPASTTAKGREERDNVRKLAEAAKQRETEQKTKLSTDRKTMRQRLDAMEASVKQFAKQVLTRAGTNLPPGSDHALAMDEARSLDRVKLLANAVLQFYNETLKRVLADLSFDDMYHRQDSIVNAYPDTYHWALDNDDLGLKTWLQRGESTYWITGKAGSGKSTLMKFLYAQERTRELLQDWAGDHDLVLLNFYFWYAGTPLQRSVEGLMRSILHQIIRGRRALATVAFGSTTESSSSRNSADWRMEDLFEAFDAIAKHRTSVCTRRFCIFIDGLDEYHGSHTELIAILDRLSNNPDIKLCVASRPWNAFLKAYEDTVPNLRLEDLSQPDIEYFVSDKICSFELGKPLTSFDDWANQSKEWTLVRPEPPRGDKRTNDIIRLIVERAEGVFLWVYLVVKSVLAGLEEGEDLEDLQERVKEYPVDLDEFFSQIIVRINPRYRDRTNQCLKLALLYMEDSQADELASWFDYYLLCRDTIGRLPQTVNEVVKKRRWRTQMAGTQRAETKEKMWEKLRNSLGSSCKDLLILPRHGRHDHTFKVTWLHRTVYDFMKVGGKKLIMDRDADLPSYFHNGNVFQHLWLGRWETLLWHGHGIALEHLGKVVEEALRRDHSLWSEDYCKTYDLLLQDYVNRPRPPLLSEGGPHAIAGLVAFGQTGYAKSLLSLADEPGKPRLPTDKLEPMVMAMFGMHDLRRFVLAEVDTDLLSAIISYIDFADVDILSSKCNRTIEQVFWARWAATISMSNDQSLEHIWQIAKLLLVASRKHRRPRFCAAPGWHLDSAHEHEWRDPIKLVKERVPKLWLSELDERVYDADYLPNSNDQMENSNQRRQVSTFKNVCFEWLQRHGSRSTFASKLSRLSKP